MESICLLKCNDRKSIPSYECDDDECPWMFELNRILTIRIDKLNVALTSFECCFMFVIGWWMICCLFHAKYTHTNRKFYWKGRFYFVWNERPSIFIFHEDNLMERATDRIKEIPWWIHQLCSWNIIGYGGYKD